MFTSYLSLGLVVFNFATAQYIPDSKSLIIKEIEHLYLDSASYGLITAVSPCATYIDPSTGKANNGLGRQTASEWIRTAFHDFVTANIYTESGGLDASIGFETDRDENVGPAFIDSLTRFSYFVNAKVSMSDLIALGTVLAVGACGGPHITMRGGRKDATQAGASGVPRPETDLQTTLTDFSNAGFVTGDAITLTACGHTMGGVHHSTFPQVTMSNTTTPPDGSDGRMNFDETVATFDASVVNDYVHGTGLKGGPLVTTPNVTVQSDLRLYNADHNGTVTRLAQSSTYFAGQCAGILQRMIETIPSGVQLTTAVDPTSTTNLKPYSVYLNVDWQGNMKLSGYVRYIQVAGTAAAPGSLTVTVIARSGTGSGPSTTANTDLSKDTGTGIWGPTHSYPFTLSFPASTGLSGLCVNGQKFPFQDSMFVVPSLSSISPDPPPFTTSPSMSTTATYTANVTVAYLTNATSPAPSSLTATFAIPQPQTGSVSPKMDTSVTGTLQKIGTAGSSFAIYSGSTSRSLSAKQAYGSSVDVAVAGQGPGVMFFKPFLANA